MTAWIGMMTAVLASVKDRLPEGPTLTAIVKG